MPTAIAAVPPPTRPIPHPAAGDGVPEVPEYAFSELWQDRKEGLTFGDFLDIINPLQHIPVVSTIYRMITGDEIGIGARLAGGALYGGAIGVAAAGALAILEDATGRSVEQHVAALLNGEAGDEPAPAGVAAAATGRPAAPEAPVSAATQQAAATGTGLAAAKPSAPAVPAEKAAAPADIALAPTAAPRLSAAAPVPAPALPAAGTDGAPDPTKPTRADAADAAAERRRIAEAIERARRAQAGLLLASLGAERDAASALPGADKDAEKGSADGPAQPFAAHPYLLPPGAPPQLISRAMEQALDRYQAAIRQRSAGTTAAAPRNVPAPVR